MSSIDSLSKSNKTIVKGSNELKETKRKILIICNALSLDTKKYTPKKSIYDIQDMYLQNSKIDRILYSEISGFVFSLSVDKRADFASNIEKLVNYSLDSRNFVNPQCQQIVIKIYDHFHIILSQIENTNNVFANYIEETQRQIKNDMKIIEREYITILGIFATIVLSFVGGITFSSSVLQNLSSISIYRISFIVVCLAFVLINLIYMMFYFIVAINNKKIKLFNIKFFDIICGVAIIIIIICWLLSITNLPEYISHITPW